MGMGPIGIMTPQKLTPYSRRETKIVALSADCAHQPIQGGRPAAAAAVAIAIQVPLLERRSCSLCFALSSWQLPGRVLCSNEICAIEFQDNGGFRLIPHSFGIS